MTEYLNQLQSIDPGLVVGLRIALIVLAAWLVITVLRRLVRLFGKRLASRLSDSEAVKRAETLNQVFLYLITVIVSLIAGMMILAEIGIPVAPILGAAGVVGIAVGFGAQSLVKDYFTGFFLLLENQIRQGDAVEIAGKIGVVEELTLRFVRLRDYEGDVHYIPNGLITTVTNRSRGFTQAVVDVAIAYQTNIDEAFAAMRKVGEELRADPVFGPKILGDLEIAGVERWVDSSLVLRCRFKVLPNERADVRREMFRRLKAAFEASGIQMPQPSLTLQSFKPAESLSARADSGASAAKS